MKNINSNVGSFAQAKKAVGFFSTKLQAKRRSLLAIIALVAVIVFSFAACDDGGGSSGSSGGSKPQTVTYTGTIDGTAYALKITEKNARYAAQRGDAYELTAAGSNKSAGTVSNVSGNVLTLKPANASTTTFTATISGTNLTALNGTITWTDGTTAEVSGTSTGGGDGGGGFGFGGGYVNTNGWTIVGIDGIFGKDNAINTITYGNGKYVAGGDNGKIAYSTNGITWNIADTGTVFEYYSSFDGNRYANVNSIAWGKDKFVAVGSNSKVATSPDGITWTAIPETNAFTYTDQSGTDNIKLSIGSIAYGKDKFVAGCTNGHIAYSSDGVTWTTINPKSLFNNYGIDLTVYVNAIAYDGNGKFVAVGSHREDIAYSSDGINWTIPEVDEDMYIYNTVAYGSGKFVAVAGNGEIATSPDGVTWTATATTIDKRLNCTAQAIAYGSGKFVAVGGKFFGNNMATSPDGVTWTNDVIDGLGQTTESWLSYESLKAIAYGDGKFVAVGSLGHIAYLSVGTSTGGSGGGTSPTITTTKLAYGTVDKTYNRIISVTGEAPITCSIESGSLPSGLTLSSLGVISGKPTAKGKFTFTVKASNAKGSKTQQLSITITGGDDLTWTAVNPFDAGDGSIAFTYGNNKFVAGLASGKIAYSSDGLSWTSVSDSKFGSSPVRSIIYSNNKFVAVGNSGKMAYSSDGESWTAVSNSSFGSTNIRSIAYGNNKFVAVGESGKMAYSSDGLSWTAVSNSRFGSLTIYAITYGNNKFVAVGDEGKMAYSSDGLSWTAVLDSTYNSTSYYIFTIAYGNGMFVAGGYLGRMAFSSDGEYWTAISDNKFSIMDVIMAIGFGNGKFVASNDKGTMTYSSDILTPVGTAPSITTSSLPNGTVGTVYNQTLSASGDTPITWSRDSGTLPDGLTISSSGVISGTPTAAGSSTFTVKATNAKGSDTKSLTITIVADSTPTPGGTPPTITTTSLPNGTVGTAYSQTLSASGDTPITWSKDSGTIPGGLTLSTAGVISGTPTAAGDSTFTVKATNATGSVTKSLTIKIVAAGTAPTITTTSLPNGTVGTAYSQSLAASGDTPITWTRDSGTLPGGLSLSSSGVISGTPTAAGDSTFIVKATNAKGSVTKSLTITIVAVSTPTPDGGTFTLTGIPSEYNGKYAYFQSGNDSDFLLIGAQIDFIADEMNLCIISNGSVSLPMWKAIKDDDDEIIDFEMYSGNDMISFNILIYDSADPDFTDYLARVIFTSEIAFSSGSATRAWSQAIIVYPDE